MKPLKVRDNLMKELIKGVTKSGIHKDQKKEANKKFAREKQDKQEDLCRQCSFPLCEEGIPTKRSDGFCCESCAEYYEEQHGNK